MSVKKCVSCWCRVVKKSGLCVRCEQINNANLIINMERKGHGLHCIKKFLENRKSNCDSSCTAYHVNRRSSSIGANK